MSSSRRSTRLIGLAGVALGLTLLPTFPSAGAAAAAPALHVAGGRLVDSSGAPVHLVGVDRSGTEYACVQGWGIFDGPSDAASVQAIAAWGINVVRVPLNEDCWLGINGVSPAYSGGSYRTAIEQYVNLLHSQGIAAILDLHWTAPGTAPATAQQPMPDADHASAFWSSVAQSFGSDRSTLFDLFNEPYPDGNQDSVAAWTCWRDGGACAGLGYSAAGMQSLVTAVRAAGASNVLLLGGVQYANSLDRWAAYVPSDPSANLAASFHMYGGNACATAACWDATVRPLAGSVPVVTGEFGESYLGNDCGSSLVSQYMSWADQQGVGYLAWAWDAWSGCQALISDYSGSPHSYGTAVRSHLQAIRGSPAPPPPRHCLAISLSGLRCGPAAAPSATPAGQAGAAAATAPAGAPGPISAGAAAPATTTARGGAAPPDGWRVARLRRLTATRGGLSLSGPRSAR